VTWQGAKLYSGSLLCDTVPISAGEQGLFKEIFETKAVFRRKGFRQNQIKEREVMYEKRNVESEPHHALLCKSTDGWDED
jgi:hypothetical protein